jgi:hypothetical protein
MRRMQGPFLVVVTLCLPLLACRPQRSSRGLSAPRSRCSRARRLSLCSLVGAGQEVLPRDRPPLYCRLTSPWLMPTAAGRWRRQ